ncbi:hypothetical protein D9M73_234390 [compost metagenome]
MAAGEDQPQAIVLQVILCHVRRLKGFQGVCQTGLGDIETGATAQAIDRLEAAGGHQPGPRAGRHAIALPALHRNEEGFMQGLLGQVEITEQADQSRQDSPRILAINGLHLLTYLGVAQHQFGIFRVTRSTSRSRLSPQPR